MIDYGQTHGFKILTVQESPMTFAFKYSFGNFEIIKSLVERGEGINSVDSEGNTIIHLVFQMFHILTSSHVQIFDYLLNQG